MCLIIDQNIHPNLVPKTSKSHILVRKHLFVQEHEYFTPIMRFPVKFDKFGIAELEYKNELKPIDSYEYNRRTNGFIPSDKFIIKEGIHSHVYGNSGEYLAIIPAGTSYYVGLYEDIVSNKLIIFKNEKVYKIWKLLQFRKVISL